MFNEIILVTAKKKIRLERLEGRGVEKKRAKLIMWNQVSDRKLRKIATKEIDNSFNITSNGLKATEVFFDVPSVGAAIITLIVAPTETTSK